MTDNLSWQKVLKMVIANEGKTYLNTSPRQFWFHQEKRGGGVIKSIFPPRKVPKGSSFGEIYIQRNLKTA